jgi:hypothetical protein
MILRATLDTLAYVLKCGGHQAEDVVRDERSARASFTRRGLFRAAGAVAAGTMFADTPVGWTFEDRVDRAQRFYMALARKTLAELEALYPEPAFSHWSIVADLVAIEYDQSVQQPLLLEPDDRLECRSEHGAGTSEDRDDAPAAAVHST